MGPRVGRSGRYDRVAALHMRVDTRAVLVNTFENARNTKTPVRFGLILENARKRSKNGAPAEVVGGRSKDWAEG